MCENGVLMDINVNKKTAPFPEDKMRLYFREMILGFEYCKYNFVIYFLKSYLNY
jgi:hypothetical protein